MNTIPPIYRFDGDCAFLPVAAQLRYGPLPTGRSGNDFQSAAIRVNSDLASLAEAHWYIEAVRWLVCHPDRPINDGLSAIAAATTARIFHVVTAE